MRPSTRSLRSLAQDEGCSSCQKERPHPEQAKRVEGRNVVGSLFLRVLCASVVTLTSKSQNTLSRRGWSVSTGEQLPTASPHFAPNAISILLLVSLPAPPP